MRSILLNWLVDIQSKMGLKKRTLFMAMNLFDRSLEKNQIQRKKLQLLGASCFMIASKFEDIHPPEVDHIVYLCENIYSKEAILRQEGEILLLLKFNLVFVSAFDALEINLIKMEYYDEQLKEMAEMILLLFLFSHKAGA